VWLSVLKLFTGSIGGDLRKAYEAKLSAGNDSERITADMEIARLENLQQNRALGGRLTAWVQIAWAAPFIAYNAKLVVWDKMLALGTTDPLSGDLMDLQSIIVGLYFGGAAAIGVVRAIKH